MRHPLLLSLLSTLAFIALAPAVGAEREPASDVRTHMYIVPKGVHMEFFNDDILANHFIPAVSRDQLPWYIGPKGGDVRKGVRSRSIPGVTASAGVATTAAGRPWDIGPKGGDTRKGAR